MLYLIWLLCSILTSTGFDLSWPTDLKWPDDPIISKSTGTGTRRILYLTAKWCKVCHDKQKPILEAMKESGWAITDINQEAHIWIVNVEYNSSLTKNYSIPSALPTFILTDLKGRELHRITGFQTAEQLNSLLTWRPSKPQQQTIRPAPISAGTWTWPGTLSRHLESVHGINTSGMSHSQMIQAHDAAHNARDY